MPNLVQNLISKPDVSTVPGPQSQASTLAPEASGSNVAAEFPEIGPVITGEVPAVYTPRGFKTPRASELAKRIPELQQAGLEFYLPKKDKSAAFVTFNPAVVSRAVIAEADQQEAISSTFPSAANFFSDAPTPEDAAARKPTTSPVAVKTPSSDAQRKTAAVRVKGLLPKQPSERQVPGAGALLNSLL